MASHGDTDIGSTFSTPESVLYITSIDRCEHILPRRILESQLCRPPREEGGMEGSRVPGEGGDGGTRGAAMRLNRQEAGMRLCTPGSSMTPRGG